MRAYVEATWGWDEAWQAEHFTQHWNPRAVHVIQSDDRDVGFLRVTKEPDRIVLQAIELLPEFQGRGVGSHVVRDLQQQATTTGCTLVLQVLKVNTRAKVLYERLGFRLEGGTRTHHTMRFGEWGRAV
jgi:ribosomal protein S18 acetylase RimI-like enzyme